MKHFVFTFFLLGSYFIINAQPSFTTSDKEAVELLKKGTLVVVVKDLEEKKIKKLSKTPEELKLYKESVTLFNTLIKEAVEKEWDLSKIKFLSEAEAEQLKETKDSNHFLLEITEVKNYKMGDFYSAHNGRQSLS